MEPDRRCHARRARSENAREVLVWVSEEKDKNNKENGTRRFLCYSQGFE
jgi:hypothetical protein